MSGAFNAIRENVPIKSFSTESEGDTEIDAGATAPSELLHREEPLLYRVTPDSPFGWVVTVGAIVLSIAMLSWVWPMIPPWFKTWQFAAVAATGAALVATAAVFTRKGLTAYRRYDHLTIQIGDQAVTFLGKVADETAGDDPLFEIIERLGYLGSAPEHRRVDDVFRDDGALAAKLRRKSKSGRWQPARIKLDHVYTSEGSSAVFRRSLTVQASGVELDERAPEWDYKVKPPRQPNESAARKLVERDRMHREQVIPAYQDLVETQEDRLEKIKQMAMDDPAIKFSELGEFLETMQVRPQTSRQRTNRQAAVPPQPTTNGNGQGDLEDLDESINDELQEAEENA